MKKLIYTPLLFLFIILGYSCSETTSTTTPVKSIALDRSTLTISVGNQTTLIITISPNNATNKTVSWASDNENTATVDANGKVTAIAAGTANITVTTNDGSKTATCVVTVNPVAKPVTAVSLSETNKTLTAGEDFTLTATVTPDDADDKTVSWASDNENTATVDANGKVTAVAAGTANITVTTNDGKKTAICAVTVNPVAKPVTAVSLSETTKTLAVGEDFTLTATIAPNDADDKTVSWASDNENTATVDANGKVTAIAAGTANITVTTNDGKKTAICAITVNAVAKPVTAVSLSETTKTLTAGEDFTLTATVTPDDADDKTISWASDNENTATVDANGKVTAVATGTANITVTTNDGSKTATCVVTVNPVPKPVTAVSLSETTKTLTAGEDFTLTATVTPDDADDKTISWASDNENTATVDANGKVTAVATGTANITVTTNDGSKTATCVVTVNPVPKPVTAVSLSETTKTLTAGEDFTLTATVTPDDADDKTISWASDNENTATVDANGKVTAVATGTANITVTTNDGSKTATCVVTVNPVPISVTEVTLDETTKTLAVGEDFTLIATVTPDDADDKTISWASDNGSVATVDANGKVTAVAVGTANITVTTNDGSKTATCVVTVNPVAKPVTAVSLSETTKTLTAGGNFTLTATVAPNDADNKTVSWASDNGSVATVDANGKVTAVAAGTANITVTTNNGSKTATCVVTVNPVAKPVTAVSLSETTKTLTAGEDFTLTATIAPNDADNKTVSWASDNGSVATVDANGKVTAVAAGKASITVTTNDGNKIAICGITVNPVAIQSPPSEDIATQLTHNGHTYYIIKNQKTWVEAAAYAVQYGGYLVHINTNEERMEISNATIGSEIPDDTNTASDGGNARYIWIGATDKDTEGTWVWDGDNDATTSNETFGTGQGAAGLGNWDAAGKYNDWGKQFDGNNNIQREPDDFTNASFNAPNGQDYGAMCIDFGGWPNGIFTQWNDIAGTNVLPFIMEVE